jgi:hypothetical protein
MHPGPGEHGQGDDPSSWWDPVRNADALPAAVEAQFPQLAGQLAAVGLAQQRASFLQQVEME